MYAYSWIIFYVIMIEKYGENDIIIICCKLLVKKHVKFNFKWFFVYYDDFIQ